MISAHFYLYRQNLNNLTIGLKQYYKTKLKYQNFYLTTVTEI